MTDPANLVYMVKIRLRTQGGAVDCDALFFDPAKANEAHMLACDAMGKGGENRLTADRRDEPMEYHAFRLNHDRGVIVVFRSDIMSVNLMVMNTQGGL